MKRKFLNILLLFFSGVLLANRFVLYDGTTKQLLAPTASDLFTANVQPLVAGTGISGNNYFAATTQTWSIDTTWLSGWFSSSIKTLTAGDGISGDNYSVKNAATWSIDTTWLTNWLNSSYVQPLSIGTGLMGSTYSVSSASTISIDESWMLAWLGENVKTLTAGSGISGGNYTVTSPATWSIDTTWLSSWLSSSAKTLTAGTGLSGSNYKVTNATTWSVDTTWLSSWLSSSAKTLTAGDGISGSNYKVTNAATWSIDTTWLLNFAGKLYRNFYILIDMHPTLVRWNTVANRTANFSTNYSVINTFYYRDSSNQLQQTVTSSGAAQPTYVAPFPEEFYPTDFELKVIDQYQNIVYYTTSIYLNTAEMASLHPEVTDKNPTIYYFTNKNSLSECYGVKTQFTDFNSYIGAYTASNATNAGGCFAVWVYPSLDDTTLCNGTARPKIPMYTGYNTFTQYYPNTTRWGDYVRSVMENPNNTIIVWRKSATKSEQYLGTLPNVWRPVTLTYYGEIMIKGQ